MVGGNVAMSRQSARRHWPMAPSRTPPHPRRRPMLRHAHSLVLVGVGRIRNGCNIFGVLYPCNICFDEARSFENGCRHAGCYENVRSRLSPFKLWNATTARYATCPCREAAISGLFRRHSSTMRKRDAYLLMMTACSSNYRQRHCSTP